MSNYIKLTTSYHNTDFKRNYELDIEPEAIPTAKQKILDINASLTAGTAGGFSSFFVSDDGEPLKQIEKAKLYVITDEILDLNPDSDESDESDASE